MKVLIVGAGLFGCVVAHELKKYNIDVLVIESREHVGGNIYCEEKDGIMIHKYGAHIFHTNNKKIWDYVNNLVPFKNYIHSPIAKYKNKIYNLPFNMNTFNQLWGINTPAEAKEIINRQRKNIIKDGTLKSFAISEVGVDVYEKLIKGYTEKQWGRSCDNLPEDILKRIPIRYVFNNNYFDDKYQGIPNYNNLIMTLLNNVNVKINTKFNIDEYLDYDLIIYTGKIDELFKYFYGVLEYRSLDFKEEKINTNNFQGVAVVNYTDKDIPFTRIIEHKHFDVDNKSNVTWITKEFPKEWKKGIEAYYPINNKKNIDLYEKYKRLSINNKKIIFGGRLAEYKYFDMDDTIESALKIVSYIVGDKSGWL